MVKIISENIYHSPLFKAILTAFLLISQTNSPANDIIAPYDWYHYQGASDAANPSRDCGPACVAMIIHYVKNIVVPIKDIRDYIGHQDGISWGDLEKSIEHWGISTTFYNVFSTQARNIIDAVNERNHILVCVVNMGGFGKGADVDGKSSDPDLHYDRYHSYDGEHCIIIKGISRDKQWVIAYDPNVFREHPYPKFWYSNGTPKGKDRYYRIFELCNTMSYFLEIEGGPGDIVSRKFSPMDHIRITGDIHLRTGTGFETGIITTLIQGVTGQVIADTKNGRFSDGLYWWHIRAGFYEGWCAEDQLEKIQPSKTSFLTVSGTVRNDTDGTPAAGGLEVTVIDETGKFTAITTTGKQEPGKYSVTFAGTDEDAAVEGYYIKVIVRDKGYILCTRIYKLTSEDIAKARAEIDISLGNSIIPENLDINRDGILDYFDLIQASRNYDRVGSGIPGDVDNDGRVDISDLICIASYFFNDVSDPSIYNPGLIKKIYDLLITETDPSPNMRLLLKKLEKLLAPIRTELLQNYPNPCNPYTWIPFSLAEQAEVIVIIRDTDGKRIRILKPGNLSADIYASKGKAVYWDGRSDTGEKVSSGVYFYTLQAGKYSDTKRLLVLR